MDMYLNDSGTANTIALGALIQLALLFAILFVIVSDLIDWLKNRHRVNQRDRFIEQYMKQYPKATRLHATQAWRRWVNR